MIFALIPFFLFVTASLSWVANEKILARVVTLALLHSRVIIHKAAMAEVQTLSVRKPSLILPWGKALEHPKK
jgi:hypothetical protein